MPLQSERAPLLMLLLLLGGGGGAEGHGYVSSPPSRSRMCNLKKNSGCGAVQYEPQSVEGPDRYPASGPADGTLASAGSGNWAPLNEQSGTRWAKTAVSAGQTDFTWQFTANHVTLDWRYYITRDGWDVNAPLGRGSFEGAPFCSAAGNMVQPPMVTTHSCTLPSKSGYHVVLAIWDVGDTAASFYNAIDLDFGGGNVPPTPPSPTTTTTTPSPTQVVRTPSPTAAPSSPPTGGGGGGGSGCGSRIPLWGACTNAEGCCVDGTVCFRQSQWYSQCVPGEPSAPTPTAATPTPPAPTGTPPSGGGGNGGCATMIPVWGSCLHAPSCCADGASCYQQSQWYAQCSKQAWIGTKIG